MKKDMEKEKETAQEINTQWRRLEDTPLRPDGTPFKCFGCAGEVPIAIGYWSLEARNYNKDDDTETVMHFCQRCALIMKRRRERGRTLFDGYGCMRYSRLGKADRDWWTSILNEKYKLNLAASSTSNVTVVEREGHEPEPPGDTFETGEFDLLEKEIAGLEKKRRAVARTIGKLGRKVAELAPAQMKIQVAAKTGKGVEEACHGLVALKNDIEGIVEKAKADWKRG